jgi:hypothetical protein
MTTLFASLLTAHVLLGLLGVMLSFAVSLMLLKRDIVRTPMVRLAFLGSLSYILSWLSGGWYYWKYYGDKVKPIILKGDFKWAHSVFMEAKEHVFLFLPIATLVLALVLHFAFDDMATNPKLKRSVATLSVVITVLAVIVTLSGVLITGGAR